ncbi:MAG: hypothetical protein QXH67_06235 [Candidatus Bathyarchaeia archaeon]
MKGRVARGSGPRCPVCGRAGVGLKQADPVFDRWVEYCSQCGWEEEVEARGGG